MDKVIEKDLLTFLKEFDIDVVSQGKLYKFIEIKPRGTKMTFTKDQPGFSSIRLLTTSDGYEVRAIGEFIEHEDIQDIKKLVNE